MKPSPRSGAQTSARVSALYAVRLRYNPESTPADPRLIAERLENITPAAAGMKKGRLQNCVCHMDAAFAYADARFRRRRNRAPLDPQYVALLGLTPDRWVAPGFARVSLCDDAERCARVD